MPTRKNNQDNLSAEHKSEQKAVNKYSSKKLDRSVFGYDLRVASVLSCRRSSHRPLLCMVVTAMLFFCYSSARLSIEELESLQTRFIEDNTQKVIINPEGPLNLLRGYIYQECGFMYNKRLYASEIEIKYTVKPDPERCKNLYELSIFERIFFDDKASNEEEKYSYEYHTALIHMFPSVDKDNHISINSTSRPSFTNFLREQPVKKHVIRFLAALLLLSEGIEVPLEYIDSTAEGNCEDRIILKTNSRKEIFFSLNTGVEVHNEITNEINKVTQKEAVQVINFFMDNAKDKKEEPKTIEQFKKGDFLDTPQFLIQTYLFEFIESAEEVKEFKKAVYEILCDMCLKQESM